MIPAPDGFAARIKRTFTDNQGKHAHYYDQLPIVAFDGDEPLVADPERKALLNLSRHGLVGIERDERIIAIMPAGGWRIEWTNKDGSSWSEPLVGWGLRADGTVAALETDADGVVIPISEISGDNRIYHPDAIANDPKSDVGET